MGSRQVPILPVSGLQKTETKIPRHAAMCKVPQGSNGAAGNQNMSIDHWDRAVEIVRRIEANGLSTTEKELLIKDALDQIDEEALEGYLDTLGSVAENMACAATEVKQAYQSAEQVLHAQVKKRTA